MGARRAGALVVLLAAMLTVPAAQAARPTGRWLVTFEDREVARSSAALSAVLGRAGAVRAGRGVPALGIATVRGSRAAIAALRRDRRVRSVSREWARDLRLMPNDPALHQREDEFGGLPGGAPVQWALGREGFPRAWDVTTGRGAVVGMVDSGVDGAHPELGSKVASADSVGGAGDPRSDEDGHGTHVSGLACAATNNGVGVAGAGWDCRLAVVRLRVDFLGGIPDEDIVAGIQRAVARGSRAVNLSFGGGPPSAALGEAIDAAVRSGVILVAAASNNPDTDQGAPASQLQPGDAPDLNAGKGLVVTAADFDDRNADTGHGSQISLAAYGFADADTGPPGLISTYPGSFTQRDAESGCPVPLFCIRKSLGGDDRYAWLEGTSMATPQVTALAALVSSLNPNLSVGERLRVIKATARRSGGWSDQLGWGIVDAGRAVEVARRIDRVAPRSRLRARRRVRLRPGRRRAPLRVRWRGRDLAGRPGLVPSGGLRYDVYLKRGHGRYRRARKRTARHAARLRLRPGVYRLYTRARDRAGNREAAPRRADARVRVRRAPR
jgi:serine protease